MRREPALSSADEAEPRRAWPDAQPPHFSLSNLDPRCRQQDQALKERAQRAVTIRNLPKTFPGLMSFPVITALAECAEAATRIPADLQAAAPGPPQPVFNFILGANFRGWPSGRGRKILIWPSGRMTI
jgi:hypothetical protein